jgi:hypothetical protein
MPRLTAMSKRWRQVPPLAVSLARITSALFGPSTADEAPEGSLNDLMGLAGNGFSTELPEWLTVTSE